MPASNTITCDILVIGSGFAGSLTALCLHQLGFDVAVVEKGHHPRFAIGESSTPIADMVLRDLSDRYDLPWLKDFSRYGSWQEHYPEISCGIKRGFSYFKHEAGYPFNTNETHHNELLVAASVDRKHSDTNWFRSDFDHFLVKKLEEYKITYLDQTNIESVSKKLRWEIQAERQEKSISIDTNFFIDATGSSTFLNKFLGIESSTSDFHTKSRALFSHFTGVTTWTDYLEESGIPTRDYPYNPDFSALHHLGNQEWMWMLRFNNNLTSAGFLIHKSDRRSSQHLSSEAEWHSLIDKYPSVEQLFNKAEPAPDPGKIIQTGRLQRRLKEAAGPGWTALPHTVGFVDPLHSTGIAHTLCGIEKLVHILSESSLDSKQQNEQLRKYEASVFQELQIIDLLVAGCYKAMPHFELFNSYTMLYFIAAIHYEQQRLAGKTPSHFLSADNSQIVDIITQSFKELNHLTTKGPTKNSYQAYRKAIRERIEPFNIAGLLDPGARNMYRHTAVNLSSN